MKLATKCSICQLPAEKLAAIDGALRDGASLQAIADRTGTGKSSLWRHQRHIEGRQTIETAPKGAAVVQQAPKTVVARRESREVSARDLEAEREEALERLEMLFDESLDGLEAAKQAIVLTKPDGSKIELPGDLRSRHGFIREAREVVRSKAELLGLLDPRASGAGINIVAIVMNPKSEELKPVDEKPAIDIQPVVEPEEK